MLTHAQQKTISRLSARDTNGSEEQFESVKGALIELAEALNEPRKPDPVAAGCFENMELFKTLAPMIKSAFHAMRPNNDDQAEPEAASVKSFAAMAGYSEEQADALWAVGFHHGKGRWDNNDAQRERDALVQLGAVAGRCQISARLSWAICEKEAHMFMCADTMFSLPSLSLVKGMLSRCALGLGVDRALDATDKGPLGWMSDREARIAKAMVALAGIDPKPQQGPAEPQADDSGWTSALELREALTLAVEPAVSRSVKIRAR